MMRIIFASVAFLACAVPASAETCFGAQENFEPGAVQLGIVNAAKTWFHEDDLTRMKAFVLKGDELLVDPSQAQGNEWLCVTYIGKKGVDTRGFVKTSDIALRAPVALPLEEWLGDWTTGKWQNLTLRKGNKPGWIYIVGSAYWAMSEENALNGAIHAGGVHGQGPLENNLVGFSQTDDETYSPWSEEAREHYGCAILVQLISHNYLMVEDSGSCGGHNVSFTRFYGRGKVRDLEGS